VINRCVVLASTSRTLFHASALQLVLTEVSLCPSGDFPPSLIYSRDVWLRELISNSNDALEKFRLTSLTKKEFGNDDPLNITIKAVQGEDEKEGRIIITGGYLRGKAGAFQAHPRQILALE
jgi:hypothetical protein